MRVLVAIPLLAAGCAAAAAPSDADRFPDVSATAADADVRAGREAALRDIAAGDPHLLYAGLPSHDFSPLDPATGLRRANTGCCIDSVSMAFEKGYDETTIAEARAGRAPTYADRVTTAVALRARFASADGVAELTPEHASVAAPGGGARVELGTLHYSFDPPDETTPYVFVVDAATGARVELQYLGEMRVRAAFGDGGRTLILRDDRFGVFYTFDLATRRWLQRFPDESAAELFEAETTR